MVDDWVMGEGKGDRGIMDVVNGLKTTRDDGRHARWTTRDRLMVVWSYWGKGGMNHNAYPSAMLYTRKTDTRPVLGK